MEWDAGKPIQPTQKRGGTAGVRIQNSWHRKGKTREDFDIINAVQCFPGKGDKRDFQPNSDAKSCCAKRLKGILEHGAYREIVVFGDVAFETVNSLISGSSVNPLVIRAAHPNRGVSKSTLDSLW
jgi:uracil-DNA glycosylase